MGKAIKTSQGAATNIHRPVEAFDNLTLPIQCRIWSVLSSTHTRM